MRHIREVALADSLGCNDCLKSSLVASSVSAGSTAKGVEGYAQHRAQEALTRAGCISQHLVCSQQSWHWVIKPRISGI